MLYHQDFSFFNIDNKIIEMPVEWTEARVYKLVLSYLRHECLWKYDNNSYNDLEARCEAYLSIIRDVNIRNLTVNEVRDKIKLIRRAYRGELAKINEANFRGFPYKPKITWFELVHEFLRAYITAEEDSKIDSLLHNKSLSSEPEEYNCYNVPQSLSSLQCRYSVNERPSCARYFPIQQNLDTCPTKLTKNGVASQAKINPPSHHASMSPLQNFVVQQPIRNIAPLSTPGDCSLIRAPDPEIRSSIKKHKSQRKFGDEFDVFGKSVACQLRELSLPHALRTQTKIQSLLAEERINSSQEKDSESTKKASHRHGHGGGSRATQSSRSSHSNFQSPSASDLSSCRGPSNGRHTKRGGRTQMENCHLDNSAAKQRYKKPGLKT